MRQSKYSNIGVADFETIVDPNQTRIWAWDICNLDKYEHEQGTDMNSFMYAIQKYKRLYFHNSKFDSSFIIDWLLKHGWQYNHENVKDGIESNYNYTFDILRNTKGVFYSMNIWFTKDIKIEIIDSLKLLPCSVDKLAKAWELPISKLKIDYELYRPPDHQLTQDESNYIKNDTEIVARVLRDFIERGFTSLTIGSNAIKDFKKAFNKADLERVFPSLPDFLDEWMRPAYKGGFVWVHPRVKGKDVGQGVVYDNNSMHPSQLRYKPMPIGMPFYFQGIPDMDMMFIVKIHLSAKIKPNHIPCISTRNSFGYLDSEYLDQVENMELTVTSVDLKLILDQYDIEQIDYIEGMYFNSAINIFNNYIDKWIAEKIEASETNNKAKREIAKLFLNNLYGKFGTRKDSQIMVPYIDGNKVKYQVEQSNKEPKAEYLPVAIFTTAYSRDLIIRSGQAVYDRLCYCDTDSLHLEGTDIPTNIDIDENELGKWKLESSFIRARFLRCKRYIEQQSDGTLEVKCGGMPNNVKEQVTWENFHEGMVYTGKLMPKVIDGGTVLLPTDYKMR